MGSIKNCENVLIHARYAFKLGEVGANTHCGSVQAKLVSEKKEASRQNRAKAKTNKTSIKTKEDGKGKPASRAKGTMLQQVKRKQQKKSPARRSSSYRIGDYVRDDDYYEYHYSRRKLLEAADIEVGQNRGERAKRGREGGRMGRGIEGHATIQMGDEEQVCR